MKLLRKVGNLRTNSSKKFFFEISMKLEQKVGNIRLIRSEEPFVFSGHNNFGIKIRNYEIRDLFFREHQFLGILIRICVRLLILNIRHCIEEN